LSWRRAGRAFALVGDWRAQFQAFLLSANATRFFTWARATEVIDVRPNAAGWSGRNEHDHVALDRLMTDFRRLAAGIYAMKGVRQRLDNAIRNSFSMLWFVHPCSHFTLGYALNRLLVLLLIIRLREKYPAFTYLPNYRLVEVDCNHPAGPLDPATCHWQPHRAYFWEKPDCQRNPAGTFPPPPPLPAVAPPHQIVAEFDVIVMRHGVTPPRQFWTLPAGASLPPNRQLLPYHYPG
jgi:hypothetical protein